MPSDAYADRVTSELTRIRRRSPRLTGAAPLPDIDGDAFKLVSAVVDRFWMAIMIVAADGRILVSNLAAERILGQKDGLMRIGETLTTNRPAETRSLTREIAEVIGRSEVQGEARGYGVVRATRPSGFSPYVVLVAPFDKAGAPGGRNEPAALIVVSDLEVRVPDCGRHLSLAFDLTDAEIRVALALLNGETPAEIAEARGVRLSTIRSQVKAIFAKTGTARQSELVGVLSRMPSLL